MMTVERACHPLGEVDRAREGALALWRRLDFGRPAAHPASERCALDLTGRYQVGDGNEFACDLPELSPLGLRVKGPKVGRVGDLCLVNVASIGIVEGVVVQAQQHSFITGVVATPRRIHRLAERFSWRLRHEADAAPERRASERVETNAEGWLETASGQVYPCRLFDVSEGGAALHLGPNALYCWVDQPVVFDGRAAKVLRLFPGGVVIKYD